MMRLRTGTCGENGGLRAGAERVHVPAAAVVAHAVPDREQGDDGDKCQVGHHPEAFVSEVDKGVGQAVRGDLAGADPDGVDAAHHVQGAEGDDESGDLAEADQGTVQGTEEHPEGDRQQHCDHRIAAALKVVPCSEGRDAQHRSDRQVDVAGDHDDGLADSYQHEDGGVEHQVLDALLGEKLSVGDLRGSEHHDEDCRNGQFAGSEDLGDELRRGGGLRRR